MLPVATRQPQLEDGGGISSTRGTCPPLLNERGRGGSVNKQLQLRCQIQKPASLYTQSPHFSQLSAYLKSLICTCSGPPLCLHILLIISAYPLPHIFVHTQCHLCILHGPPIFLNTHRAQFVSHISVSHISLHT